MPEQNQFDSKEEMYFSWWLEELKQEGYIVSWEKNDYSYELADEVWKSYDKHMKTKTKEVFEQLLRGHEYTPDFNISWATIYPEVEGILYTPFSSKTKMNKSLVAQETGENFVMMKSVVEVKANFDRNNMTRLVQLNRKWMWEKHKVFVNLVKIPDLFKQTFTPERYLLTDKRTQDRKLRFSPTLLDQFIHNVISKRMEL